MSGSEQDKQKYNHYPFHAPRLWHGMTFWAWLRLLWINGFKVSWQRSYLILPVTFAAIFNSVVGLIQTLLYSWRINEKSVPIKPPVIIIGHWRSGTTMLHELLVHDDQFAYPTTFQCFCPAHFLITERFAPMMAFMLPKKRPMDNMLMGWDLPQEDEFALCNMGVGSPYSHLAFPNQHTDEEKYLDFQGLNAAKVSRWKKGLVWFMRRITFQTNKTIVLKSPGHTARVKVLLELFPEAKFIHITRNPLSIFPSTVRLWKSLHFIQGLQTPDMANVEDDVLDSFRRMYEQFENDKKLLKPERFFELRYEDLIADPVKMLESIYQKCDLGDFEKARGAIQKFVDEKKSYKTNKHELSSEMREKIQTAWAPYFRQYGYAEEKLESAAKH
jgi:omega-hydroxy-beta-dihydromenaquinone-9 sulfotransferase